MFKNGYISSEHLIQYQAAKIFCKNLYACVLIFFYLTCIYPNVAIITLNNMMPICNWFGNVLKKVAFCDIANIEKSQIFGLFSFTLFYFI